MKTARLLFLAVAITSLGASGWAAQDDPHKGHHPAGAATAPTTKPLPGKAGAEMARMDTQTKAMREMHDKVMAAKTPEARSALMAEHMKTMQDGMAMMNGATPGGMGSMKDGMKGGMKGDMSVDHRMMEKRMEMMAASMQMMMDRLPAMPAK